MASADTVALASQAGGHTFAFQKPIIQNKQPPGRYLRPLP